MHRWLANWQLRALEAANVHTATGGAPGTATSPEALRQFGVPRARRGHPGAGDFHRTVAPRREPSFNCASPSTPARWNCSAAHWHIPSSRCCTPASRVRAARGWLTPASAWATAGGHLGSGVCLRTRHGARLRRLGRRPLHGRRAVAAHGDTALWAACRRHRRPGLRPRSAGQLPGGRRASGYPATPPTATSTPTTTSPGKPARVTGRGVDSEHKAPYDPQRASRAVDTTSTTSSTWCASASPSPSGSAGPRT